MAVTLPGPANVPVVSVRTTARVHDVPVDQSGAGLARLGAATVELTNRIRAQQIENDIVRADTALQTDLDRARLEFARDPDYETIPERYEQRAQEIIERHGQSFRAPLARRQWEQRSTERLARSRGQIDQLVFQRGTEAGRAGLIENANALELIIQSEDQTPEARAAAMVRLEEAVRGAQQRGFIAEDDAATMIGRARHAAAVFERTQGLRAQAIEHEDSIWRESGGNLSVALELAREIDDPAMRDMVTDRVNARHNESEAARRDNVRGAMEAAMTHLEGGGTIDGLSAGVADVLTRAGHMNDLRAYAADRSAGGLLRFPAAASASALAELMIEARRDPAGFASRDLTGERLHMNADDFEEALEHQGYLRGEAPEEGPSLVQRAFDDVLAIAEPMAQASGLNVRSDAADNAEMRGAFRMFMLREARAFVAENNRRPSAQEAEAIARTALLEARTPGVMGMGGSRRRVFESRTRGGADVRVRYSQIPEYQQRRLIRIFMSENNGREPSETDIEAMYQLEIAQER